MATATARFSSITGDGWIVRSSPYSAAMRGQSVSAALAACAWTAAISGTRYGMRASRSRRQLAGCGGARLDQPLERIAFPAERVVAAQPVDGLAPGDRRDPRSGPGRNAIARPRVERDDERIVERVLRQLEIVADSNERGKDCGGLFAKDILDDVFRVDHGPVSPPVPRRESRRSRISRRTLLFDTRMDGPDLDGTDAGARDAGCPGDRLVEVFAAQKIEARKLLARLGKRAVGRQRPSLSAQSFPAA